MCTFLPRIVVAPDVSPCASRLHRQVDELTADLHKRSGIPKHVEVMIRQFPKDMHAMSMFGAALFAMQVSGVQVWGGCRGTFVL